MKNIKTITISITILMLLVSCVSLQPTDPTLLEDPFTYIQEFEGMSKGDLYKLSRLWFAETYNSAEEVMTFEDIESGVLKGTGIGEMKVGGDMFSRQFKYNISIYIKDGKVKLEFNNISANTYYNSTFAALSGGTGSVAGIDGSMIVYQTYFDAFSEYFKTLEEHFVDNITSPEVNSEW